MSQYEHPYWYPPAAVGANLSSSGSSSGGPSGSPSGGPKIPPAAPTHPNALFEMAKLGTVIGLTGAGAANLHRLQQGEVEPGDAALSTLRTGVASGIATAAATLVARQFRSPTLALAATLVTGTAAMYALNPAAKVKPEDSGPLGADTPQKN